MGTLTVIFVCGALKFNVSESGNSDTIKVWPECCCDKISPPKMRQNDLELKNISIVSIFSTIATKKRVS